MSSKHLRVISVIIGIFGVIFGIILGATCKINTSEWYSSARYVFNVGLMFETWIAFDLIVLLFNWCASVLGRLENIEKAICGDKAEDTSSSYKSLFNAATEKMKTINSNISNSEEGTVDKSMPTAPAPTHVSDNEWKCPNCGKVNQNYTGTCGCGQQKPR